MDLKNKSLKQSALTDLVKNHSSVVNAQRLATVKHADNLIVIDDGKFIEEDNVQVVLA